MIHLKDMSRAARDLFDSGDYLVTVEKVRDWLTEEKVTGLKKQLADGQRLHGSIIEMLRKQIDREVDDRFPKKVVSRLWREDGTPENPEVVAIGVPQRVVDLWEDVRDGVPAEGRNFETEDGPVKLIPKDFLSGRRTGESVALLFFVEGGCPWDSILAAYYQRRADSYHGHEKSHKRMTERLQDQRLLPAKTT